MTKPRRFILQAIDPDHGSPVFEAMFVAEQPDEVRRLLGDGAKDDPELEMHYRLESDEVAAISRHFSVPFDPGGRPTSLYQWTQSREFPYLVHGGFELALMIDGRKPFTRMGPDHYPPHRHWNEDRFDHYVEQGLLHKEITLEKLDESIQARDGRVFEGLRTAYYTLKGEEWRIQAWQLVAKAASKSGWNDALEHLEGMLLGYEDWQNEWWAEKRRTDHQQFGTQLVYVAVTSSELASIEDAGYRALPFMNHDVKLVSAFAEEAGDEEPRRLLATSSIGRLIRLRVKALPFLELVGASQQRVHQLPAARIKDLNRLIQGEIELA